MILLNLIKKRIIAKKNIYINPEDITTVKQQITTVWDKIQQHDFYTGCGKRDCHWCNFVKTNNMAIALHELIEEPKKRFKINLGGRKSLYRYESNYVCFFSKMNYKNHTIFYSPGLFYTFFPLWEAVVRK